MSISWRRFVSALVLVAGLTLTACDTSNSNAVGFFNDGGGGANGLTLGFAAQPTILLNAGNGGSANPQIVAVGRFNNDANLDFAVANNGTNDVSVFLGDGAGGFAAEQLFATAASGPTAIAVGDFDGDNDLDLAVATANQLSILLNDGTGAFPNRNDFNVGTSNRGIGVADFDGVNGPDVAIADAGNDSVNVLLNDGANGFNAFNFTSAGNLSNIRGLVVANLNGDNFPDLAIANFGDAFGTFWLSSGNAANLFPAANASNGLPMPANATAQMIAAGDLNGDGIDDIAIPSIDGNNSVLRTFVNDGTGVFAIGTTTPVSQDPFGAAMGDFNLDGRVDPVAGSAFGLNLNGTGEAAIFLGNGDGTVAAQQPFSVIANQVVRSIAVGDFNGDNKPDIITAAGGAAHLLLNTSN